MRIVIFTKLQVSWGNYLETVIIQCFGELKISDFLEFISRSVRPIMNIRDLSHSRVVYILNS